MTGANRILIVRTSAIGDIVFSSPLVSAFRRGNPNAYIAWLAQPQCAPLLAHHPDLDEVIVWPFQEWRAMWLARRWGALARAVWAFRTMLRKRRFDLAVDLQGLLKSGGVTRLSGARERIGLGSKEGSQWLMTKTIPRGGDPERIGSEYLFLAETLGLPIGEFAMAVHYGADDARFAATLIRREGLAGNYAVVCPFTTRPQKHWFEDRWAELASRLCIDLRLPVVMLGGPADREAAERICERAGPGLTDLAGQTSLLQAAALIHHSDLVVAVDTGLGHMGIALGRPSLLLFGSTCPYRDTTHANARVLYHDLPCSPCRRGPSCYGEFTCMRLIETGEILENAKELLGRAP